MTKSQRHESIRERAREALRNLYHNATPDYPRLDDDAAEQFQAWFEDAATHEIEYMNDGGAYAGTESRYRQTLEAPCNAGKLKSARARAYYVAKGMRDMRAERSRCNALDSRESMTNCLWETAAEEFGTLHTYGRGGRTLAPDGLISQRGGGSFAIREDYFDDVPIERVCEGIRILESFNRHVADWCASVPEMFADYVAEEARDGLDANVVLSDT
jgi:hypothetical protein